MEFKIATVFTICVAWLGSSISLAQDANSWTQWRGNDRNAVVPGTSWPDTLDEQSLSVSWRVELGPSYSGPIVTADRVFVTETENKANEVVRALDRQSGRELWSRSWAGSMEVPFFARANGSWIRSTPAYSDGKLYVGGIRDVMVCLDADNGEELWRIDFPGSTGSKLPQFGFVCSPLVVDQHLYVQAGGAFCKIDKNNGNVIWKSLEDGGGMYGSAFSSPILATIAGTEQIVVQTRNDLCGIDLETGKVLWSRQIPSFRGMNILTPIVDQNRVFTSSYQNNAWLFEVAGNGQQQQLNQKWMTGTRCYMSTPVLVKGHLYAHLQNQRFACIDLETGEEKWRSNRFGKYASLVAQGDKVLALDQRGELILFRATPEKFDVLDRRKFTDQETWAHLAVANQELFVRELNAMTAFQWKSAQPSENQ